MKKLIVVLVAVLAVFGVVLSLNAPAPAPVITPAPAQEAPAAAEAPAADVPAEEAAAPEIPAVQGLDYDAIRALHDPDDIAVSVAGETETWASFCSFLRSNGMQVEDYFAQMAAYYQIAPDWNGSAGDGVTFARFVVNQAKDDLTGIALIRAFAAEKGIAFDEAELAALTPDALAAEILGEGATGEDLRGVVDSRLHMDLEDYLSSNTASALFRKCYETLYGENGASVSDEDAVAWLEEQDYLSASHILMLTIDPTTGEPLEEAAVAEKKAKAAEIAAELRAIEDPEQLQRRFAELKAEYCEDGGKVAYPDGYTFTPGTMVAQFEDTVRALDNYAVSEPVESTYGLHIIMRLPLSAESLLYSSQGTPSTARVQLSSLRFAEEIDAFLQAHPAEYAEGLEELDVTQFIKAD